MAHRSSNGRHTPPETRGRIPELSSPDRGSGWLSDVEDRLSDTHELLVDKATHFIRERPGVSISVALVIGGVLGWLIKRRV